MVWGRRSMGQAEVQLSRLSLSTLGRLCPELAVLPQRLLCSAGAQAGSRREPRAAHPVQAAVSSCRFWVRHFARVSTCSAQQAVGWFLVKEWRPRERKALVQSPGLTSW